jgi:hypothetical protein
MADQGQQPFRRDPVVVAQLVDRAMRLLAKRWSFSDRQWIRVGQSMPEATRTEYRAARVIVLRKLCPPGSDLGGPTGGRSCGGGRRIIRKGHEFS